MRECFRAVLFGCCLVGLSAALSGCSIMKGSKEKKPGVRYSEAVGLSEVGKSLDVSVPRNDFQVSLEKGRGVFGPRLVEVYRRMRGAPEWRILDVRDGDPFSKVGLRDFDVLLAANDFLIFDPDRFRAFVQFLPKGYDASILIRRDAQVLELKPRIVDSSSRAESGEGRVSTEP